MSANLFTISMQACGFLHMIFSEFSSLFYRLLIIRLLFSGNDLVSFSPLVYLCDQGSEFIEGTDSRMRAMYR